MTDSIIKEFIQNGKIIIVEKYFDGERYKGMQINSVDQENSINLHYLPLNPSSYYSEFSTNFNPNNPSDYKFVNEIDLPKENYWLDGDLFEMRLTHKFNGKYLGNILISNNEGKRLACFVTQDSNKLFHYTFVDFTGANILAKSEWDLEYEFEGVYDEKGYKKYIEVMRELKVLLSFTTQLDMNNEEQLVQYNDREVTEEGAKIFENFNNSVLKIMKDAQSMIDEKNPQTLEDSEDKEETNESDEIDYYEEYYGDYL